MIKMLISVSAVSHKYFKHLPVPTSESQSGVASESSASDRPASASCTRPLPVIAKSLWALKCYADIPPWLHQDDSKYL